MPESLARFLPSIEAALQESLRDGPEELIAASRYVMGWQAADGTPVESGGGKRIRPALVLFGASLFTDTPEAALPGAVAVELVHNFSLVHDEIQDRDMERHGRPTLYALHGAAQAINAGDFLYARAIDALVNAPLAAERRVAALGRLQDAITRMIAGQWSDITFESRTDVTPDEYTTMVAGKTGAMLAVPLAIGAVLAGAGQEEAEGIRSWGETVGLAFQVQDDYLGIWGDPNLTGKSNVNDIVRKKKTFPIIHGLTTPGAGVILDAYANEALDADDVDRVVNSLNEAGSADFTRARARELVALAEQKLDALPLEPERRAQLAEVGTYLVERDA